MYYVCSVIHILRNENGFMLSTYVYSLYTKMMQTADVYTKNYNNTCYCPTNNHFLLQDNNIFLRIYKIIPYK